MSTAEFRSFFPAIITDSIYNDSSLDRVFQKMNSLPSFFSQYDKFRIHTEEKNWRLEIPLPGATKEDLKISLKESDKLLVEVVGENTWSQGEIREFRLPPAADAENITAEMKNGLLVIEVPKKKAFQDKVVRIK